MSREDDDRPTSREDSPLLGLESDHDDHGKRRTAFHDTTPLPLLQLLAVYAIKLVVPIASVQVLPYVNKMVAGFDLANKEDVGYYTGLLSFAHSAGQIATIYAWGRLSGTADEPS